MTNISIRQIDGEEAEGATGVGPLLRLFIRWRWWVSYAGAAILMLALAL
ncbi:hypothetical protein [Variovorax sp. YR216]|nr:hypothetical protein [Variovorax sp. YR216]